MTEAFLALLPHYGIWAVGLTTFLSCLAVPVPASLMMLGAGAFIASGDLEAGPVVALALTGAMIGDQIGFGLGRRGGHGLARIIARYPRRAEPLAVALRMLEQRGASAVFLSRWLFSPLGPYANLAGGASGMDWLRFTLAGAAGEVVWVTIYVGLGVLFSERLAELAEVLGNASGMLAAGAVALGMALWLKHRRAAGPSRLAIRARSFREAHRRDRRSGSRARR